MKIEIEQAQYQALCQKSKEQEEQILLLKAELTWLKEQIGLSKKRLYARSSEQDVPGQEALLFNEAEAKANEQADEPTLETITYTRRKKQKGQRELDLAHLPVEEEHYRLPEEEAVCPQCQGALHEMGEQVREEIKVVPATLKRVRHIRHNYACRHCQKEEITTPVLCAAMPRPAFPKSIASASAVGFIMSQIGRKNWLFANTPKGARASAVIYSIVETAKENSVDPFLYLTHLFEQLPNMRIGDNDALDALLPWAEPVKVRCAVAARSR